MTRQWSKYQSNIFDWVSTNESKHLVVEAVAGSGKTTTGVEVFNLLSPEDESVFIAFNKHIQMELAKRLPDTATAVTYHALGFKAIRDAVGGKIEVDGYKVNSALERRLGKGLGYLFPAIRQLVSLFKANNYPYDYETMQDTILYHGIDIGDDDDKNLPIIANEVKQLLIPPDMTDVKSIDFDDMCWLPVVNELPCHKYDFIFVDEVQDTNRIQLDLALRHVNGFSRIVACGDRYQSLYGFRGADVDSIPNLIQSLNADVLPLSITYRNPTKIVELVKSKYPHIPIEARDGAPEGVVEDVLFYKSFDKMQSRDLVLCRLNAPMVQPCLELIKRGRKAIIKGKDIGKNLVAMIKKVQKLRNPYNIDEFMFELREFVSIEVEKLYAADKTTQATILQDKMDTIVALAEGCNSILELIYRTESIFNEETTGVTFSTVHKAKGLEAQNVFILRPDLIPFGRAKLPWQIQQEQNIEYVAYTRSLNSLYFIQ